MAKKPITAPGAASEDEILQLIGPALHWWEDSESVLMRLFKHICGEAEPVASVAYEYAPRSVRYSMLEEALKHYSFRFVPDETAKILKAMKRLNKLAAVRNEIAHGMITHHTQAGKDGTVVSGYYLVSPPSEGWPHDPGYRFHHTPTTIAAWVEQVRDQRWEVLQIYQALLIRDQEEQSKADRDWFMQRHQATAIAAGRVPASEIGKYMKARKDWD